MTTHLKKETKRLLRLANLLVLLVHSVSSLSVDVRQMRRLVFQAEYNLRCSSVSDEVSRSALSTIADANYKQIAEICKTGNYQLQRQIRVSHRSNSD